MLLPYSIETEHDNDSFPSLTFAICILVAGAHFWVHGLLGPVQRENIFYRFGAVPFDFKAWAPITCTFLHGDFLHLAGNLFFFWIYGSVLERRIGLLRFSVLYILGAYASVAAHLLTVAHFANDEPAIGASGAISAVLGAFFVMFPCSNMKVLVFSPISLRPLPAQAPAFIVLGIWFLAQLGYGLQITADFANVAFWAHIAGFVFGAVAGSYFLKEEKAIERNLIEKASTSKLLEAIPLLADGRIKEARGCLAEFNPSDRKQPPPGNWRIAEAFLASRLDADEKLAMERLSAERDRIDPSAPCAFLQIHHLACSIAPVKIDASAHLKAAIAASRQGMGGYADSAFALCARRMLSNPLEFERQSANLAAAFARHKESRRDNGKPAGRSS